MIPFTVQKGNIYALPIVHYRMEMAAQVKLAFDAIKPDCVAVELPETITLQALHAASRLPDLSVIVAFDKQNQPLYYLAEPCDPVFEGLRCALESQVSAFCIDLDVEGYPDIQEPIPDTYAIQRIGLQHYYEIYRKNARGTIPEDFQREIHIARRLKELSLQYDKVLFIGGMAHIENVLRLMEGTHFPKTTHAVREGIQLCTLTEESCRETMAEFGWICRHYEERRGTADFPPDRQKLIFELYKSASLNYIKNSGNTFSMAQLRTTMKFVRNYALATGGLMPDLFQILSAARGCVEGNYAYEVWELATAYPYRRNVDGLPELDLTAKEVWGHSKSLRFHLKQPGRKNSTYFDRHRKKNSRLRFQPPGPFSICSYPPEDLSIENFGDFLKKKGTQLLSEEGARTIPFSSSLEDGLDVRETIRHWAEGKLYVKAKGKPPGGVGSVVMIFDEDAPKAEEEAFQEKYNWKTTWLGEHNQESDMAFYGTSPTLNVVGPGISRCEYGGFLMSYPPRRMLNVWEDPDYAECRTKAEVLLMAAIDYATKPVVVYVAAKPPRSFFKSFAQRFGKKVIYIPRGQLSPVTLDKLRVFHVLDGHERRGIADEYIF